MAIPKLTYSDYEDQVFKVLKDKYPNDTVTRNRHLPSKSEGTRQIDIAIENEVGGHGILIIVDCKNYGRKVDVKHVEAFLGMMEDVKAHVGIMVTSLGFTKKAKKRIDESKVRLEILSPKEVEDIEFDIEICQVCDPPEDSFRGVISYHERLVRFIGRAARKRRTIYWETCDKSGCNNVRCECGVITGVPEYAQHEPVECEGGCGLQFRIEREWQGGGDVSEEVVAEFAPRFPVGPIRPILRKAFTNRLMVADFKLLEAQLERHLESISDLSLEPTDVDFAQVRTHARNPLVTDLLIECLTKAQIAYEENHRQKDNRPIIQFEPQPIANAIRQIKRWEKSLTNEK